MGPEAEPFCPGVAHVAVKESLSRYAARHLHPEVARERIRASVASALAGVNQIRPPSIAMPATLEVQFLSPDMAEQATWIRGVERTGDRSVAVTDEDPLRLFGTFVTLVYLTRSLVETR